MSLGKEIRSGGHKPYLTAVSPALPHIQSQGNDSGREESARVMLIAACEEDCLLIQAQLEQQNFPALFTSAKNDDELQRAMNPGDWDIVMIDLRTRSLNLPEAIDCIRLRMPSVPVILLASRPDEAGARELLKRGGMDLVLKDGIDGLVPAIDRSLRRSFLRRRAAAGKVPEKSAEPMMVQRSDRWFNIARRIIKRSNAPAGGVQTGSDVTRYKQFVQKLEESEEKFRSLAEQSLAGTCIVQDDTLKYVNLRFAEMFGYRPADIIDKISLQDLIVPEDRQRIEARIRHCASRGRPAVHEEFRGLKRTGSMIHAEVFGSRAAYLGKPAIIGIVLDLTEKRNLLQELRQAQKMEAVGQLTSGIAHDFNNILSAIVGYASMLGKEIKPDDPVKSFVGQILTSADRAAKLIRSLLTFSRKRTTDFQLIDINEIIQRAEKLIHWIKGVNIDLRVSTTARQLVVNADPGQIEQVLMNLATNAADAMPDGGVLSIETDVMSCDAVGKATAVRHEQYAVITVTDTGVGMDEKTREKIFEPFFTTKEAERGTGLGLSIVSGIIQQHKGAICCESRPGAGTRFSIYLPLLPVAGKNGETSDQASATAVRF